jgi:hypothetical protein
MIEIKISPALIVRCVGYQLRYRTFTQGKLVGAKRVAQHILIYLLDVAEFN